MDDLFSLITAYIITLTEDIKKHIIVKNILGNKNSISNFPIKPKNTNVIKGSIRQFQAIH